MQLSRKCDALSRDARPKLHKRASGSESSFEQYVMTSMDDDNDGAQDAQDGERRRADGSITAVMTMLTRTFLFV